MSSKSAKKKQQKQLKRQKKAKRANLIKQKHKTKAYKQEVFVKMMDQWRQLAKQKAAYDSINLDDDNEN